MSSYTNACRGSVAKTHFFIPLIVNIGGIPPMMEPTFNWLEALERFYEGFSIRKT